MEFIRLVHPTNYDPNTGRFSDLEFKGKSSDGSGMSLVQWDCANEKSGVICQHVADHYSDVAGTPVVFLKIREEDFPANVTLHPSPEFHPTNDECHWDARTQNDRKLKDLRKRPVTDYFICENGIVRPVTTDDAASWSR
jgi:hypothetical protein